MKGVGRDRHKSGLGTTRGPVGLAMGLGHSELAGATHSPQLVARSVSTTFPISCFLWQSLMEFV